MIRKSLTSLFLLASMAFASNAQQVKDFKPTLDSLQTLLKERTTVSAVVKASKIVARGNTLDFHMTSNFGDYPWRNTDVM